MEIGLGDLEVAGRRQNRAANIFGGLDPRRDSFLHVLNGFFRSRAVAHAAGQIRHGRGKTTAFLCGQRRDYHRILESGHVSHPVL